MSDQPPISSLQQPGWAAAYQRPVWIAYALAFILVLATLLARLALGFASGDPPITILFVPALIVCAYMGGVGPGLVATTLAILAAAFFLLTPLSSIALLTRFQFIQLGALLVTGVLISVLNEGLHRARRQAEADKQIKGRLAAIVESSNDAIIGKDLHGIVTSWNASAERIFGFSATEILNQSITMIIPLDYHAQEATILQRIANGEHIASFDAIRQHKNGTLVDVSISVSPIRDSSGRIIGASKIAHDITEHKRTEAALRESEHKLSTLFELLPIGVSILNANQTVAYINPALERIVGLSQEEIITGSYRGRRYIRPDGSPMPSTEFASSQAIKQQAAVYDVETGIIQDDGSITWTNASAVPVTLADWRVVIVTADITERKHAEAALRQSEAHFAIAFRANPAAMSITRMSDGCFIDINASHERLFGYMRAELIGQRGGAMGMYADPNQRANVVQIVSEQGSLREAELTLRTKSGELREVLCSLEILELNGQACMLGSVFDITDRKRAEQALRESDERLRVVTETAQVGLVIVDAEHRYRYANRAYAAIFHLPTADIVGARVADILSQVYDTQIRPRLERAFRGERISYELIISPRQLGVDERYYAVTYDPGMYRSAAVVVVVVVDITDRKRAEQALQRTANLLRIRDDASRTFAEVGQEYQVLLDQVARTISTVLGEGCSIRLLDSAGIKMPLAALYDQDPEILEIQRVILSETPLRIDEQSLSAHSFYSQKALLVPVVDQEQRHRDTNPPYWSFIDNLGVHSMIIVPMRVQGQSIGILVVYRYRPEQPAFDQHDLNLAQDLTDRASLAISNARLLQQVQYELAERTQAEQQLRYQANLLAQVSDAIIATDINFTIQSWNAAAEELYGWPAQEVIGRTLQEFLPTDYLDKSRQQIMTTFLRDEQWKGEVRQPHRDGRQLQILSSVNLLKDAANQPAGAVAVNRDITVRKQMEEALRESEARFAIAFRANPAALVIFRQADGCFLDANETYQQLLGYRREELIGRNANDLHIFPDPNARAEMISKLAAQGAIDNFEIGIRTKSDQHRTILLSCESVELGGEGCILAIGIDITDRKQAEQALQRSADRLLVLADASRAFAEVGSEYEALLTYIARSTTEVLSESCSIRLLSEDGLWLQLIAIYDLDEQKLELTQTILSDAPLSIEDPSFPARIFRSRQPQLLAVLDPEQVRASAKPEHWSIVDHLGIHSMIGVPMRVQGQTIGVLIISRHKRGRPSFDQHDLTLTQDLADRAALAISNARLLQQIQYELAERTRAEAEVRTLSSELEQRVVARTAELEAANHELEAFSYSVSHDLRAPLRAINGFARILLEDYTGDLPAEGQHYFKLVQDNAQKMGHLVDDLLAFSRLSRQPLKKRLVDPSVLVGQCLNELHGEQVDRQINIQIGELLVCQADPALLKQVWLNLITNALKYTRRREAARIEIDSTRVGVETIYYVKDNGVGFDMRYSDKLFGVFQRMHRAEDYEGTGVGLAIVQRIVQRHGGRVWAEAAINHGATFFFTLGRDIP